MQIKETKLSIRRLEVVGPVQQIICTLISRKSEADKRNQMYLHNGRLSLTQKINIEKK